MNISYPQVIQVSSIYQKYPKALCLIAKCRISINSMNCKKISENMTEEGAPTESPSFCLHSFPFTGILVYTLLMSTDVSLTLGSMKISSKF
jgi:hypothetical protein